jgi:hypothetical protein
MCTIVTELLAETRHDDVKWIQLSRHGKEVVVVTLDGGKV